MSQYNVTMEQYDNERAKHVKVMAPSPEEAWAIAEMKNPGWFTVEVQ